jgi:tripartite-type tricarboxylate transporter receptor subunit TctC
MIQSATHVVNAHLHKKLPYDPLNDFVAIAPISAQIGVLIVHPSMPVRTTKDLVALAKAKPGQVVYGSSGYGSFVHLAMALFNATASTSMIHVVYKGGGPAAVAIGSGEVQAMIATIANVMSQIQAKRVRAIAVSSDRRVALFPKLPTIAESGVAGYEFTGWVGALAPAGTPKPIVDKLNADIHKAMRITAVAEKLAAQALEPLFLTADQFSQRLRSDYEKYGKVVKLSGATVN